MRTMIDLQPGEAVQATVVPGRFLHQTALVTGAAHGIGAAIARRLAQEGARVMLADMDEEAMNATAAGISEDGGSVDAFVCDVRQRHAVDEMVEGIIARAGRVDVLIHSAGVCKGVPFIETDDSLWDATLDTNLKGPFLVSRALAPHMIRQRGGSLVFIASTNSYEGEALQAPYNASKGGLFLLAKTLARELGRYGIRSNAVGPGFIRTRLSEPFLSEPSFIHKYLDAENPAIPLRRLGLPADVTGPALFLASRDAAFVNGAMLLVDGGQLA